MRHLKVYIVTYKRSDILNDTLDKLFKSDFSEVENTEVTVINNHTSFSLDEKFKNRVRVLHNQLRPDWSNGNLAENWNQALLDGFRDLSNPDSEYVVTLQNVGWICHGNGQLVAIKLDRHQTALFAEIPW